MSESTHTFTPETARRFAHGESMTHAMILTMAAQERGCQCEPYVDWFTYRRWQAQGYQVQKGEKGVQLTTYRPITETKGGKESRKTIPWRSTVFCRCQVQPKSGNGAGHD